MKYLILIAYPPDGWSKASPEQQQRWMADHGRFHDTVGSAILGGEALAGPDTATTMRHVAGKPVLTDGPFAETAERIGGFYLVEAPDLDTVTGWCEILPDGYSLEIRPCITVDLPD
jgi:hypothetical protein